MTVWIIFVLSVWLFLALDLGVFNKKPHVIKTKEAAIWTSIWISIALGFGFYSPYYKFRYIHYSLVVILAYVGLKLIFSHHVEIPEWFSLAVIALSLAAGIVTSQIVAKNAGEKV